MKKRHSKILKYTVIALLMSSNYINAQTINRSVVSSSGGSAKLDNLNVDWTLGELAILTLRTEDLILTQGFHQPILTATTLATELEDLNFNIYPNPTSSTIFIDQDKPITWDVSIVNQVGLLEQNHRIGSSHSTIDLSNLISGVYLIIIREANGSRHVIYRLIKQ